MNAPTRKLPLRALSDSAAVPRSMTEARRPIRALIIQPPPIKGVRSLLPQVDDEGGEGIGFKPPLGILYVGTMVKERSPHEVMVIDAGAERLDFDAVVERAKAFRPDVVGISAWTDFWYPAHHTGERIKAALPDVHLTYGGPHLGIYPKETLAVPFVDSVIVGDGEYPFLYLCNLVANGEVDNSLPGLHFQEHGVKEHPDTFYIQRELDELPIPERTLVPLENYSSVVGKESSVTTMITSRGCPFRCTFCKLNFQKTLCRSADNVVEEFRRIHQLGLKEVEVYDDTFTWSRSRLEEICDKLIEADLGIRWAIRDRVSSPSVDDKLMRLLYRAGCRRIHYGVESGSQHVIDRMKKKITLDQVRNAVATARQAGLTVLTYFMFGNLEETKEDMRRTIDFAIELDADYAQFSITIPYAGTEMYEDALRRGLIDEDYWLAYARHPSPNFRIPKLIEEHADRRTLLDLRNEAVRRYYFRPRYIARHLRSLTSPGELWRKGRMALHLAKGLFTRPATD